MLIIIQKKVISKTRRFILIVKLIDIEFQDDSKGSCERQNCI